jgi:hypothetical protein
MQIGGPLSVLERAWSSCQLGAPGKTLTNSSLAVTSSSMETLKDIVKGGLVRLRAE